MKICVGVGCACVFVWVCARACIMTGDTAGFGSIREGSVRVMGDFGRGRGGYKEGEARPPRGAYRGDRGDFGRRGGYREGERGGGVRVEERGRAGELAYCLFKRMCFIGPQIGS